VEICLSGTGHEKSAFGCLLTYFSFINFGNPLDTSKILVWAFNWHILTKVSADWKGETRLGLMVFHTSWSEINWAWDGSGFLMWVVLD
jgi:hypothetical protein